MNFLIFSSEHLIIFLGSIPFVFWYSYKVDLFDFKTLISSIKISKPIFKSLDCILLLFKPKIVLALHETFFIIKSSSVKIKTG